MKSYEPTLKKLDSILNKKRKNIEALITDLNNFSSKGKQYHLISSVKQIFQLTETQYNNLNEQGKQKLIHSLQKGAKTIVEENRENHDRGWYFYYMNEEEHKKTRLHRLLCHPKQSRLVVFDLETRKYECISMEIMKKNEEIILSKIEKVAAKVFHSREKDMNFEIQIYKNALFELKTSYPEIRLNGHLYLLSKKEMRRFNKIV